MTRIVGIKERKGTVARYDARQKEEEERKKKTSGETRYLAREKLKCQVAVKTQASAYLFHYRASRHSNVQVRGINVLPRAIAFTLRKFVEDSTPASPVYENGNYIVK